MVEDEVCELTVGVVGEDVMGMARTYATDARVLDNLSDCDAPDLTTESRVAPSDLEVRVAEGGVEGRAEVSSSSVSTRPIQITEEPRWMIEWKLATLEPWKANADPYLFFPSKMACLG